MQSSPPKLIKNVAFVGSTGSGKSTTCNTLSKLRPGPFIVGHDEISCTNQIQEHLCLDLPLRIIDMPGFQDNRKAEKQVDEIIQQIILKLADPTANSTNNLDAFVLVCKLNPRPVTLKKDLERMKELFGTVSLKSLILLVIYNSKQEREKSDFFRKFREMSEINRILREAKEEDVNEDWFCVWDNLDPIRGQEEELLRKIQKLEPYTYQKYLESEKEMKVLIDNRIKQEMEREIKRISKEHEDDQYLKKNYIKECEKKFEKEKQELLRSTESAQEEVRNFLSIRSQMKEEHEAQLKEMYERMRIESDKYDAETRELLMSNLKTSREMMVEVMERNKQLLNEQNARLIQFLSQSGQNCPKEKGFLAHQMEAISNVGVGIIGSLGKELEKKCNLF